MGKLTIDDIFLRTQAAHTLTIDDGRYQCTSKLIASSVALQPQQTKGFSSGGVHIIAAIVRRTGIALIVPFVPCDRLPNRPCSIDLHVLSAARMLGSLVFSISVARTTLQSGRPLLSPLNHHRLGYVFRIGWLWLWIRAGFASFSFHLPSEKNRHSFRSIA